MAKSALAAAQLVHTAAEEGPPVVPPAPIINSVSERASRMFIDVDATFPDGATNRTLLTVIGHTAGTNPFDGLTADGALLVDGVVQVMPTEDGGVESAVPVLAHDAEQWITAFYEVPDIEL